MKERVRLSAFIYMVFAALLPLNQAFKLSDGLTINKITGLLIMVVCGLTVLYRSKGKLKIPQEVLPVILFAIWIFFTSAWSVGDLGLPINLLGSFLMLLSCLFIQFNQKEIFFIKAMLIVVYAAFSVYIVFIASENALRATFSSETGESDPNALALVLAAGLLVAVDFFFENKYKLLSLACIAFIGIAVLMTGSRTGIIAVFCYMIVNAKKKSKKTIRVFIVIAVLVFTILFLIDKGMINTETLDRLTLTSVKDSGGNGRWEIWKIYLKAFFDNPARMLFGYGTGTAHEITYMFSGRKVSSHNDYLLYATTLGLVGLTLFLTIIIRFIRKGIQSESAISVALLSILVVGCMGINYFEKKDAFNLLIMAWQFACIKNVTRLKTKEHATCEIDK